ncbi:MAG: hypothetical protein AAB669_02410 [Patescibacteria group bacterium]
MKQSGREERTIRSIHTNLIYVVVAAIIIALIVMFNFSRQGLLGPIKGGSLRGMTLRWKISEQDSSRKLLVNQLEGPGTPEYDRDWPESVIALERDSNGDLVALPRFQGQLEYCTTNPITCP